MAWKAFWPGTASRPDLLAVLARRGAIGICCVVAGCAGPRYGYDGFGGPQNPSPSLSTASQANVTLRLALAAQAGGDAVGAARFYRELAQSPSVDPHTLLAAADGLAAAGFNDEAIEAYGRVQARDPARDARLGALLGLTRAHLATSEPEIALAFVNQALALAPEYPRAMVDRGVALDTLLRHAEAQAAYRAALLITPRDIAARNDLGLSLALSGQYDAAVAMLEPLARSPSATPKIRENLALALGLSGDSERAADITRMDLDETRAAANLSFYASMRAAQP